VNPDRSELLEIFRRQVGDHNLIRALLEAFYLAVSNLEVISRKPALGNLSGGWIYKYSRVTTYNIGFGFNLGEYWTGRRVKIPAGFL
jgi:hypothetical protein